MAQAAETYDNVPVYTGQPSAPALRQRSALSIGQVLEKAIPHLKMALPKSMDPERMARIALTTIRRSNDLQKCEVNSLAGAILESASLGLEIDSRGLAYLVPYGGNATLIVGYKGMMQLAYRSGKLNNIYADVVFKKEVEAGNVAIELGAERSLRHNFDILSSGPLRKESGDNPIVLAYAVAVFKDGSKHFEFVTEAEVMKRKGVSPAAAKGFLWSKWQDEAWKKTAIRKLCKYMDLSPEIQRAVVLDEQADTEKGKQNYDFAGTIDVDFAANVPDPEEEQPAPSQALAPQAPPAKTEGADTAPPAEKTPPRTRKAPEAAARPAEAPGVSPEPDPAPQGQASVQMSHDPRAGEVFGQGYMITCPNNDKPVDERDCAGKTCRKDCPAFGL